MLIACVCMYVCVGLRYVVVGECGVVWVRVWMWMRMRWEYG